MKDRLLYGTIGLLVGVVVMQWTMPAGQATVATSPVGNIIAMDAVYFLAADGNVWQLANAPAGGGVWHPAFTLPIPVEDVHFFSNGTVVAKSGDVWSTYITGDWVNYGSPPSGTVRNDASSWGKVKSGFRGK